MKRRIFAVILSCLMVLSLIPFAAFATDAECTHENRTTQIVVKATCDAAGIAKWTCNDCKKSDYVTVPTHNLDEGEVTKEPSCEKSGEIVYTCQDCKKTFKETLEKLEHSYKEDYEIATCQHGPVVVSKCRNCGEYEMDGDDYAVWVEVGPAIDHSFADAGKLNIKGGFKFYDYKHSEADCLKGGYEFKICIYCHQVEEAIGLSEEMLTPEKIKEIADKYWQPADDHNWDDGVLMEDACADCDGHTHTVFTCSGCKDKTIDTKDNPGKLDETHEHSYKTIKEVKASCTEEYLKIEECTHCGHTKKMTGEKLEHNFDGEKQTMKPNCSEEGYYYWDCTNENCDEIKVEKDKDGKVITIEKDPTVHTGNEKVEVKMAATCTAPGIGRYTCADCGAALEKEYRELPIVHTKDESTFEETVPHTCKTPGKATYKCKFCPAIIEEVVPASHSDNEEIWGEISCDESKTYYKRLTCRVCGDQRIVETAPLAHTPSAEGAFPATCKNPGRYGVICIVCDASIDAVEIPDQPKLEHVYTEKLIPADCVNRAYIKLTCVCGDVQEIDIAGVDEKNEDGTWVHPEWQPTGHSKNTRRTKQAKPATCTEDSYEVWSCDYCTSYTKLIEAKKEHKVDGESAYVTKHQKPVCNAGGYFYDECSLCKDVTNVRTLENEPPVADAHLGGASDDYVLKPNCVTGSTGIARVRCVYCDEPWYIIKNEGTDEEEKVTFTVVEFSHTWDNQVSTKPTCTSDGIQYWYCTVCNKTATELEVTLNATKYPTTITGQHSYGKYVPTGDETVCGGKTSVRVCSVCGDEDTKYESGDASKHVFVAIPYEKNCVMDAYIIERCDVCGYEKAPFEVSDGDGINGYNGTGHSKPSSDVITRYTDATCDKGVFKQQYCTRCQLVIKEEAMVGEEYKALGHAEPTDATEIFTIESTCDKEGREFYYCSECDKPVDIKVYDKKPCAKIEKTSDNVDKKYTVQTTCVDSGYYYEICLYCRELLDEETLIFEKFGDAFHDFESETLVSGTCTTKGIEKKICKYCDKVDYCTTDYGHVLDNGTHAEKCNSPVTVTYKCTLCKKAVKTETKTFTHNYVDNKILVDATCVDGKMEQKCTNCGAKKTVDIPADEEHVMSEAQLYFPATCLEGTRYGFACVNCLTPKDGKWDLYDPEKADHNYEFVHEDAACDHAERWRMTCKVCKDVTYKPVEGGAPATQHDYIYTYADNSKHSVTCSKCDLNEKVDCYEASQEVNGVGTYILTVTDVDATCKVGAHKEFDCLICKEENVVVPGSMSNTLSTTNHAMDVETELLAASCSTAGIMKKTCSCKNASKVKAEYVTIPKLDDHDFGDEVIFQEPGLSACFMICKECDHLEVTASVGTLTSEQINCLRGIHTEKEVDAVVPPEGSCVDGHKGYTYCTVCLKLLSEKVVIEAGHSYVKATEGYNEDGVYVIMYACSNCPKTKIEELK